MGRLTAAQVKHTIKPGNYLDGEGLRLQVTKSGSKTWILRFQLNNKTREMGLGSVKSVTLKAARDKAGDARKLLEAGIDPIAHRHALKQSVADNNEWTFDKCATAYIDSHSQGWSNEKHIAQWRNTIEQYCSPVFGNLPVSQVNTALVMQVIEPIWETRTETASRVRGRIENILAWAIARKYRDAPNPALWRGHIDTMLPKPTKVQTVRHHPAMPYTDVPAFMSVLQPKDSTTAKAMQFTILTAVRTVEVIGAHWNEIDLSAEVWTIPAERMKSKLEHRVPLSRQALALLNSLSTTQGWLFPSFQYGKHIGNNAMLKFLKKDMQHPTLTVHGFRSSFRDWCAEQTNYPREIAEAALAHTLKDKTEAAYQRADLLEKRRKLMQSWGDYCSHSQTNVNSNNVVAINGW